MPRPVAVPIITLSRRSLITLGVAAVGLMLVYALVGGNGAPAYQTAPVERGQITLSVTATGSLKPVSLVEVSSQLSGQIAAVEVDFNQTVKKGQMLARLDSEILSAKVREAEAALEVAQAGELIRKAALVKAESDLANTRSRSRVADAETTGARALYEEAQRDLNRKQALRQRNTVSGRDVDRAQTEYEAKAAALRAGELKQQAESAGIRAAQASLRMAEAELQNARATIEQRRAALDQAKIQLKRAEIRAPIDGVVIARNVDPGQTVAASLEAPTLFAIAEDLGRMEVHARIDEADVGRIRLGQQASFTVDSFPGRTFRGEVVQLRKAPEIIQGVVAYTVVIATDNPERLLLPGLTAMVRVEIQRIEDAIKVPNAALRFRPLEASADVDTESSVWILGKDGSPQRVPVQLGISGSNSTQLVSGLSEGQRVVVGAVPGGADEAGFGVRIGF